MAIRFACPDCGSGLTVKDIERGKSARCPGCQRIIRVPACDYYEVLQVSPNAEEDIIHAAYKRLAMKWHPDRNPGDPAALDQTKLLIESYEILADARRRQEYDQHRLTNESGKNTNQRPQARNEPERRPETKKEPEKPRPKARESAPDGNHEPEMCWFCETEKADAEPEKVSLYHHRDRLKLKILVPICLSCRSRRGWTDRLLKLCIFAIFALLTAVTLSLFLPSLWEPNSTFRFALPTFVFGCCSLGVVGMFWSGNRYQAAKLKSFPPIRSRLASGWRFDKPS